MQTTVQKARQIRWVCSVMFSDNSDVGFVLHGQSISDVGCAKMLVLQELHSPSSQAHPEVPTWSVRFMLWRGKDPWATSNWGAGTRLNVCRPFSLTATSLVQMKKGRKQLWKSGSWGKDRAKDITLLEAGTTGSLLESTFLWLTRIAQSAFYITAQYSKLSSWSWPGRHYRRTTLSP